MTRPPLQGRGAVVTGGGRGIGAAVARALAVAGARVVVSARTEGEIEETAAALRSAGGEAWAVVSDATDEASVRRLGEESRRRLGSVDILIANAGAAASAPIAKITLEEWNRMFAVNATSAFLCIREFFPEMTARGWGRIVTVASMAGLEGARYIAHYSAAKHAVVGLTRSLAMEAANHGVTVNALCPGYVATGMTDRTLANVQERTGLPREGALAAVLATTGQKRLVAAEEVAAQALALCLENAAGRNGETVVIEGGERAS